jgi:hypothetical protein
VAAAFSGFSVFFIEFWAAELLALVVPGSEAAAIPTLSTSAVAVAITFMVPRIPKYPQVTVPA